MTDFPVWWIEAVSSAFVKIIMKQMVGVFTYIRPINTKIGQQVQLEELNHLRLIKQIQVVSSC